MRTAVLQIMIWVLALAVAGRARADRLELETGDVFTGRILRIDENEVSIQLEGGGILSFRLSAVRNVRKNVGDLGESKVVFEKPQKEIVDIRAPSTFKFPSLKGKNGEGRAPSEVPSAKDSAGGPASSAGLAAGGAGADRRGSGTEGRVTVSKHGFSLVPPKGLAVWSEAQSGAVPLAFRDPQTQATFVVTVKASSESIEKIKADALRSYTEQFRVFHVVRDEAIEPGPQDAGSEGWILEIESRVGAFSVRQLQVFRKRGLSVAVLTYAALEDSYARLQQSFEKSAATFRFESRTGDPQQSLRSPAVTEARQPSTLKPGLAKEQRP